MAEGSFPQLQTIMKSLDGESWSRLEPFRLPVLRSVHHTRINYPFLHTLAHFWDARKHVFRFGTVELCPLPEEFEALLGYNLDPTCQLAIPRLRSPPPHATQQQLKTMLDQPSQIPVSSIINSEIRLESLIGILLGIGTREVHWPRAMALCLYSQFFARVSFRELRLEDPPCLGSSRERVQSFSTHSGGNPRGSGQLRLIWETFRQPDAIGGKCSFSLPLCLVSFFYRSLTAFPLISIDVVS